MQDIPLAGMNFDGTALTGTVQFPAGDYKFLPSYGLVTPGNYTWPDFTDATLSDALYVTHTGENFPAAFMLNTPLDAVPAYTVSLEGPKQTVSATLRRAVSRVDVLFIRAEKDAATGVYTEKPGADVFGPEKLAGVNLAYTGANSRLGLSGEKVSGLSDVSHTIGTPADVVTMGTGESTVVGADKYDFENVQPADIISGSAHLKGTYLIPNPDNTGTTGFSMQLTSGKGSARTIALRDKIPVERNKATLIRIYVLGENVFTTGVDFEVEVDTVWDGSNFVDGEIDRQSQGDRIMNNRIHTTIILAAAAFAACSGSERADIAPVTETSRIMLVREGAADVSVYAFRREGAVFLFDTLFREGWTPDGKLSVRLPNGHYKFLFASGAADRIALQPAPLTRQTSWEEAAFVLRENAAVPGTCFPADELFLQYPASGANTVYTIDGAAQTVRARLTRAVCRIAVIVKRGYHDGTRYVEVPYAKPQSVLGQIGRIELSADHTGQRVNPDGSSGTATVTATLAAADYAELTDAGFVRFEGPFVIPPADGGEIGLDISVVPAAGAALQPAQLRLTGKAERNKQLEITLWITSDYPVIGVEIQTAPITEEQDGDTGIWE